MLDLAGLYLKLPTLLQQIACSMEGWRIQRKRFGNAFPDLLMKLEERANLYAEQIVAYRDKRLRDFILHSAGTVPFYRRRFKELKISPEDIRGLEDLKSLPILTKDEVKENCNELVSESIPPGQQILTHTSGTTGAGLRFSTTMRAIQEQWAVWWRYRRLHGISLNTWCGYFVGHSIVPVVQTIPPFWRYNYPGKQIFFSASHMNFDNLKFYVEELRRRQPPWLHGYPSLLALLASYLLDSGSELGYSIEWITTGAENLLPHQVDLIEKAFGARPRQHYGMTEAIANISECKHGRLHVDEDFAATEFITVPGSNIFKVIGTNFTNPATPLLRYDVQDLITLTDENSCRCGNPGRVVLAIDGRQEDYIVLKDGTRLGRLDHIFKGTVNIREAQIFQSRVGEITIRIVRGSSYTDADREKLLCEARKRVGKETEIIIEYVQKLERSERGKLRFVVSNIQQGKLEMV
jgi:phenylacetate-CoA ligase